MLNPSNPSSNTPHATDNNATFKNTSQSHPAAPLKIAIKKLSHGQDLPLPSYGSLDAAGLDLYAAIEKELILQPMERRLIPCGFSMALPKGYEAQIRPRSGLAYKYGITILNAPGTIDADYRGEICALLINLGSAPFTIERAMRIAQMIIAPYSPAAWQQVEEFTEETSRGAGGFGSTGH